MPWTSLAPILRETVRARGISRAVGAAELIAAINAACSRNFSDPNHLAVRALSYGNRELTIYCKSPVYAAAVRDQRTTLIDPVRKLFSNLPVDSIRFVFRHSL